MTMMIYLTNMIPTPSFFEKEGNTERGYDLFSRLLKDRIILLFNDINDDLACSVIAQLLYLESLDSEKEICVYINSPGGSVSAGLGIYDTIKRLKCDVSTVCVGMAASMGAFLLAAGTKGKRYSLANSQIMIHQVLGGASGQTSDVAIEVDHMLKVKHRINKLMAGFTGKSEQQIETDTDRNKWMFAEDALEYGIIDAVIDD